MTYYVCLAAPRKALSQARAAFGRVVHFTAATETPFGKATVGTHSGWDASMLTVGFSSAPLMGLGARKQGPRNSDCSELFVSIVRTLLQVGSNSSVAFLGHMMVGLINTEKVPVTEQKIVKLADLHDCMRTVEEDVRYLVTP